MVSMSGSFTIYFSASATKPSCSATARLASAEDTQSTMSAGDIAVYPNPFTDEVNVSLASPETVTGIVVFNSLGQFVQQVEKASIGSNNTIRLSRELNGGLYFIKVEGADGSMYFRVVKQ